MTYIECEKCIHFKVCNRSSEFVSLVKKLNDINYNEDNFKIIIECKDHLSSNTVSFRK